MDAVREQQDQIQPHIFDLKQVAATLDPATGDAAERKKRYDELQLRFECAGNGTRMNMAKIMKSFAPGLFVGGDATDLPPDNLELERFFRLPKGHERRIHGHRHAGVRIVQEGPTLIPTLDAHLRQRTPFTMDQLRPYFGEDIPPSQRAACHRRSIMRKARSRKQRPVLLAELEKRFREPL